LAAVSAIEWRSSHRFADLVRRLNGFGCARDAQCRYGFYRKIETLGESSKARALRGRMAQFSLKIFLVGGGGLTQTWSRMDETEKLFQPTEQ